MHMHNVNVLIILCIILGSFVKLSMCACNIFTLPYQFRSNMHHLAMDFLTPEGRTRVDQVNKNFFNSVNELLWATRVIPYS